ncbi:MAG: lipoyl(octanoyl) transferase LipB [Sulfuritalea sp.]|nr:lipoyl(octanoyl) transferase LipB [Sulfuritalea sp.]
MIVRRLGRADYPETFAAMQEFTATRSDKTADELWLCEHPPVFTQGLSGKPEHLLKDIGIPVVQIDRGGQITYHGPGQVVVYLLIDLRRRGIMVRELVRRIEQAVIDVLVGHGINAARRVGAPGVYVGQAKIAALGLRIKHGCSYHGVSLNVDMDLTPYGAINPCGYEGMAVTQLRDFGVECDTARVGDALAEHLTRQLEKTTP